jgi:hypothetical protein
MEEEVPTAHLHSAQLSWVAADIRLIRCLG